jgi:hypothetical protein
MVQCLVDKYRFSLKVVEVGQLGGLRVQLWPERSEDIFLVGQSSYAAKLSSSPLGTIASLEDRLRNLPDLLLLRERAYAEAKVNLGELRLLVGKPFEHSARLEELGQRQAEIMRALDLTKNQASNGLSAMEEITPALEEIRKLQEKASVKISVG